MPKPFWTGFISNLFVRVFTGVFPAVLGWNCCWFCMADVVWQRPCLRLITDFWHLLDFCFPGHCGLSAWFIDLAGAVVARAQPKASLQSFSAFFSLGERMELAYSFSWCMYFPVLAACVGFGCWHVETAHWQIIICCQATLQNSCVALLCWRHLPSTLLQPSSQFACFLVAGKQPGFFALHVLGNLSPKIHVLAVCCVYAKINKRRQKL